MRNAFVTTLTSLAQRDPSIMLLTGDLGFSVIEQFRDALPQQYLNAGVAEQNMVSVAAGLALCGERVFTYSIIPFATFRCLEHIRNDVCYHNVPVCIVGVGGGYSYGHMGSTHHALEDIAVMRALPNMMVVCPGDPWEVEQAVMSIAQHDGPCYLRLGKAGEPRLHARNTGFTLGKSIRMREGVDLTLVATGNMLETAAQVHARLQERSIQARLLSMHTVKPIDADAVREAAEQTRLIVTIEEHSPIGGLGSAVAETLALQHTPCRQLLLAAPDSFARTVGSHQYFRNKAGLTPEHITEGILSLLS